MAQSLPSSGGHTPRFQRANSDWRAIKAPPPRMRLSLAVYFPAKIPNKNFLFSGVTVSGGGAIACISRTYLPRMSCSETQSGLPCACQSCSMNAAYSIGMSCIMLSGTFGLFPAATMRVISGPHMPSTISPTARFTTSYDGGWPQNASCTARSGRGRPSVSANIRLPVTANLPLPRSCQCRTPRAEPRVSYYEVLVCQCHTKRRRQVCH